ncbi:hypothetical protein Zmor_018589 [Zophobas morio]|uniref:Carboxylic ester hydrolase n=1 Tax=Zophobas morio TaxID=2755281 RepID=A0AA38MDL9_9CUCU|nr:hypothetical protein Zmor_018589 [Zophobas morio]
MFPCLAVVFILLQIAFTYSELLVHLPTGKILGRKATTLQNIDYFVFEKIPYAAPPVGSLRFKPPQPHDSWDGILNTTSLNTTCFQTSRDVDVQSEDCLYINVYTPQLPDKNCEASLNVVFYIHGGGFTDGFPQPFTPDLLINNNIIFVTFNYRLGIFGFLSTQDDVIPGNNGLKDQQYALRWTHQNIHLFGGDPNKITIMGHSSGGASIAYQLSNPKNKGLFQGAILQSGTYLIPGCFQRDPRKIAFATAARLNSHFKTNNNSQDLLEYLRTLDSKTLAKAGADAFKIGNDPENFYLFQGFVWAPVVEVKNENAFLTEKMYGLLKAGNFVSVPILIGHNSEESVSFASDMAAFKKQMQVYDDHVDWLVPKDMQILDIKDSTTMGTSIRNIYTRGGAFADNLRDAVKYCSDTSLNRGIIKYAELFSKSSTAYFYQFSYDGQLGHRDAPFNDTERVGHGAELSYLFCYRMSCDISSYPETDRLTRERLLTLWTNFIKYQNPTPEPSKLLQNVTWPPVKTDDGNFYYLDINENLKIKNHPKEERYKAWNALYDSLGYDDFDTY